MKKDMEYRRFDNTVILRLDPDEEICEQLMKVAVRERIRLASISGLGAVKELTTGVFDTVTKEYHANDFQGAFEIVSLTGTITQKDGECVSACTFKRRGCERKCIRRSSEPGGCQRYGGNYSSGVSGQVGRKFSERLD